MSNLYTGTIDTEGQYQTLASLTGLTFTDGNKYEIQIQNQAYVREGLTGDGFLINSDRPFIYTCASDDLYIKTNTICVVNIADYVGNSGGGGGGTTPSATRSLGEIVTSNIQISDDKLHLLDGALLTNTNYPDFVTKVATLYAQDPTSSFFAQPTKEVTGLNITEVGTLTKDNGVISGFTGSNYATTNVAPSINGNTFEYVVKIKTPSSFSNDAINTLIGNGQSGADYNICCPTLFIQGYNAKLGANIAISQNDYVLAWNTTGTVALQTNTVYYIKLEFTGSKYAISYSLDNETWVEDLSESSYSFPYTLNSTLGLGKCVGYSDSHFEGGSIDLKETYVKVNGQTVWTGAQITEGSAEANWQAHVTAYGVYDRYVYDSTNNTVRLPKLSYDVIREEGNNTYHAAPRYEYVCVKED